MYRCEVAFPNFLLCLEELVKPSLIDFAPELVSPLYYHFFIIRVDLARLSSPVKFYTSGFAQLLFLLG